MPPPPLPPGRREASPGDQRAPPNPPPPPPTQTRGRAGGRPPHPPHPPQQGSHRRGPPPPQGRGGAPPLRRNGDAVRATAAGPAPANPHRRAGATRTTEQEGGRAPHDPPVTAAHSEVTEGGFQVRWGPQGSGPRAAPHPPPPRGGTSAPTARARRKGARRRHGESQKGVLQAAARNESGEAAARHPPPPPPHQPASRGGPGPHPPRQGGCTPPAREGSRSVTRPPSPSPRLKWGPRRTSGPTPAHRDAAQIVPREAGWARTGVVWGATPPMDSTTPVTPALLPAQGKRRATSRGRECGDNKREGKPAAPQPANH